MTHDQIHATIACMGEDRMGMLANHGVQAVFHYAPLHYLVFIARSKALKGKPTLKKEGFKDSHLRTKSRGIDVARGFGSYAHLTLHAAPAILKAKLHAGFPHISVAAPVTAVDAVPFSLCRYNVAMARQLRHDGVGGFPESPINGRYYNGHQLPIARTPEDMSSMLNHHLAVGTMIEVLVHGDLPLPDGTRIICYANVDADIAQGVFDELESSWKIEVREPPSTYARNDHFAKAVSDFTELALNDASWRGNGLEFDKFS
jgi:hypothetical protein